MNCKPGDLAIVVVGGTELDNLMLGRVVRVTRLYRSGQHWYYEGDLIKLKDSFGPATVEAIADRTLRPIRPGEGEDEMLLIAGKPTEVTA